MDSTTRRQYYGQYIIVDSTSDNENHCRRALAIQYHYFFYYQFFYLSIRIIVDVQYHWSTIDVDDGPYREVKKR